MQVVIDEDAGFCFGVARSIQMAEAGLEGHGRLYCLGELVHNEEELMRLEKLGLQIIDRKAFKELRNQRVLLRAHGEPPETFEMAKKNGLELIDACCPIVSRLQDRIAAAYQEIHDVGQVVIYGNPDHPEVEGLTGKIGKQAIVVAHKDDLDRIDFSQPLHLFSQTTKDALGFEEIEAAIKAQFRARKMPLEKYFRRTKSLCGQVSKRSSGMAQFAAGHDVVVFAAGAKSSNGRYLFDICRKVNSRSYFVTSAEEVSKDWFFEAKSVGVSGATSSPGWLLQKVADAISAI